MAKACGGPAACTAGLLMLCSRTIATMQQIYAAGHTFKYWRRSNIHSQQCTPFAAATDIISVSRLYTQWQKLQQTNSAAVKADIAATTYSKYSDIRHSMYNAWQYLLTCRCNTKKAACDMSSSCRRASQPCTHASSATFLSRIQNKHQLINMQLQFSGIKLKLQNIL